jgi:hypothetical protein
MGSWKGNRDPEFLPFPDIELFFAGKINVVFIQKLNVNIPEGVIIQWIADSHIKVVNTSFGYLEFYVK